MTYHIHCPRCNRKLAEMEGVAVLRLRCPRCKLRFQWPVLASEVIPDDEKPLESLKQTKLQPSPSS